MKALMKKSGSLSLILLTYLICHNIIKPENSRNNVKSREQKSDFLHLIDWI